MDRLLTLRVPLRWVTAIALLLAYTPVPGSRHGGTASAQELPRYELPPVVVTAGRIPVPFGTVARAVTVINREQIERAPASDLAGLLEYVIGLDVRRRGAQGVQGDLHVRGGGFEQVLVMVDGARVNDPQTGHHHLNIPLDLEDIERIEVLRGPAARHLGPGAFDGVVQIITRHSADRTAVVHLESGEHALRDASTTLSITSGPMAHRLTFSSSSSGGWRPDTDHRITTADWGVRLTGEAITADLFAGWQDKRFGANQFYSAAFPEEWEHVRTGLVSGSVQHNLGGAILTHRFWWRSGDDEFLLVRSDPSFYRNRHATDTMGAETQATITGRTGTTSVGAEAGIDRIVSSNLGNHRRNRGGFFVEQRLELGAVSLGLGTSAYHYAGWGWQTSPGGEVAVHLNPAHVLFGSVGRSFRTPSFTDLYYSDPANLGDENLRPEQAWTAEAGIRHLGAAVMGEVVLFRRAGQDVIDWVRSDPTDPWQASNIARITVRGLEVTGTWLPAHTSTAPVERLQVGYVRLMLDHRTPGLNSRYVFEHLRHQVIADLDHRLPGALSVSWRGRYEQRAGEKAHAVVDLRLSRRAGRLELWVAATNLFDSRYSDFDVVPLPGRWVRAGIRLGG